MYGLSCSVFPFFSWFISQFFCNLVIINFLVVLRIRITIIYKPVLHNIDYISSLVFLFFQQLSMLQTFIKMLYFNKRYLGIFSIFFSKSTSFIFFCKCFLHHMPLGIFNGVHYHDIWALSKLTWLFSQIMCDWKAWIFPFYRCRLGMCCRPLQRAHYSDFIRITAFRDTRIKQLISSLFKRGVHTVRNMLKASSRFWFEDSVIATCRTVLQEEQVAFCSIFHVHS